MQRKEVEFLRLVCSRPRMYYASASSFRDVLTFICGIHCSVDRPHGDFGDFAKFIHQRLGTLTATPWTDAVLDAFAELDMHQACERLERLISEWEATWSSEEPDSSP